MNYSIENAYLRVTVTTAGAQVCSVLRKCDGVEHMWQADPTVWGYHAPILFPWTGKLTGGKLEAKGAVYSGGQHGFARNTEHKLLRQGPDSLTLVLEADEATRAIWPFAFRLLSTFTLDGDKLIHGLTVENRDPEPMRFGLGFHPAFAIPFDGAHTAADYELRFSREESPLCLSTRPSGLLNGKCYYLGRNLTTLPVTPELFANDSHCMVNLTSQTLGLYERGTGRGVECTISGFPYVLIWSKPVAPVPFVCIEPWHSLPGTEEGPLDWNSRPAAAVLAPGDTWSTALETRFLR